MNKAIITLALILFSAYACSVKNTEEQPSDIIDTLVTVESDPVVTPSDDGIVRISLKDGEGKVSVRKKKSQTIKIEFEVKGYKKIFAQLTSADSLANIRITQICMPDGTMDGPFGHNLTYNVSSDGIYKILVGENMMAGDPWGGNFQLDVKLLK